MSKSVHTPPSPYYIVVHIQVKHSSLPSKMFIDLLVERNKSYSNDIEVLQKSLLRLDAEEQYKNAIEKHWQNCLDYGFTIQTY